MGQFAWREQVETLSTMLGAHEASPGQITAGLDELKSALDDLRLRVWGLLMAASADDPHEFQQQFRTRRGTEMCRALSTDVRSGKLSSSHSGLPALGATAGDLAAAVKEVTRKPSKRRRKDAP
jgi:hypothetical protein